MVSLRTNNINNFRFYVNIAAREIIIILFLIDIILYNHIDNFKIISKDYIFNLKIYKELKKINLFIQKYDIFNSLKNFLDQLDRIKF